MGDDRILQERAVLSWSQQLWKRRVLLEPGKSSEKPMFNAHLAISGVKGMSGPRCTGPLLNRVHGLTSDACPVVLLYMQG